MAMNKQRRTSNISNIFSYDDAGNIVIKDYSQVIRYNWNGILHGFIGQLSVSSIPAATTDTDKFLVSDGGVLKFRTGAEVLTDIGATNIYISDGTLTGNRVVTLDNKQLVFKSNQSTLQNYTFSIGVPTGVTQSALPVSSVYEGEYLISFTNANPLVKRFWVRNQSAIQRFATINSVYADVTAESLGAGRVTNQYFQTYRGSSLDISTSSQNTMTGINNSIGHSYQVGLGATTTQIFTSQVIANNNTIVNVVGTIGTAWGNISSVSVSFFTTYQNATITNYYGYYTMATVGTSSGPIGTITNYYGMFFNTPTVGATGTITNRWGVYAPDVAMRHYLNGNLLLGTTTDAGYKLDVSGTARISNTLSVITTGTTNDVALFKAIEPYITIEAAGASNSASIFFRPSNSSINATIQNRTGGGLEFYTGATPSVSATIKSTGAVVVNSTLGLNGVEDSIKSGKYTPTLTNGTNVASSAVNTNTFKYVRVGNVVNVSGWLSLAATSANTLTELEISLPIASNITSDEDVSGVANTLSGGYGQIRDNATNNTARMYVQPNSTSNLVWYMEFSYFII